MSTFSKLAESCDTVITIAANGSDLYRRTIGYLQSPGVLGDEAAETFATALDLFERAFPSGAIGILAFPGFHRAGPTLAMGAASEAARIVETLALRARMVTKSRRTPVVLDPAFEREGLAVVARLTETEGNA